jgi:hypothetical protein
VPGAGNLAAHRLQQRFALARREVRSIASGQRVGHAVVFVLERPPHDLGWMGGDHELDAEMADCVVERVTGHTGPDEPRQRLLDRCLLGPASRLTLDLAPPPHPVVLFGDVREIEEVREASRHRQRRLDRHCPQLGGERFEVIVPASGTRELGECTHPFHSLEMRDAFVTAQGFAQQLSEEPDIVPKRFVRIFAHRGPDGIAESSKRGIG